MNTPSSALLLSVVLMLCACQPEVAPPRIICHNANCVEPANPEEDDSIASLGASLALVDAQGRPRIDGVEVDAFWYGEQSRCLFAHDLAAPEEAVEMSEVTEVLLAHLTTRHQQGLALTRSGAPFTVFVELKGHVGESKSEKHSPEQRVAHVRCAATLGQSLRDRSPVPVVLAYTSFDAALLSELHKDEIFQQLRADGASSTMLGYLIGVPAPLDSQSKPFDTLPPDVPIDLLSAHPHWTRHATLEAAESMGWELGLWMFSAVPETYDAISRYEPHYITTSEATALSGWLEQQGW